MGPIWVPILGLHIRPAGGYWWYVPRHVCVSGCRALPDTWTNSEILSTGTCSNQPHILSKWYILDSLLSAPNESRVRKMALWTLDWPQYGHTLSHNHRSLQRPRKHLPSPLVSRHRAMPMLAKAWIAAPPGSAVLGLEVFGVPRVLDMGSELWMRSLPSLQTSPGGCSVTFLKVTWE